MLVVNYDRIVFCYVLPAAESFYTKFCIKLGCLLDDGLFKIFDGRLYLMLTSVFTQEFFLPTSQVHTEPKVAINIQYYNYNGSSRAVYG